MPAVPAFCCTVSGWLNGHRFCLLSTYTDGLASFLADLQLLAGKGAAGTLGEMTVLERRGSHGQGNKERGSEKLELHLESSMGLTRKLELASDKDCLEAEELRWLVFLSRGGSKQAFIYLFVSITFP